MNIFHLESGAWISSIWIKMDKKYILLIVLATIITEKVISPRFDKYEGNGKSIWYQE